MLRPIRVRATYSADFLHFCDLTLVINVGHISACIASGRVGGGGGLANEGQTRGYQPKRPGGGLGGP